jgi:hypothetical protein
LLLDFKCGAITVQYAAFNNILPNYVSRTGYNEVDLTDNKASNTKMTSLHYKPHLQMT